jgi:hypothetical protein
MIINKEDLYNKKGVLVIGSPRSGTHHLCHGLYTASDIKNKKFQGEIYTNFDTAQIIKILDPILNSNQFTFSSLVQWVPKNLLVQYRNYLKSNFYLINLRRLDKVAQYRSWCCARLMWQYNHEHSLNWTIIEKDLPFFVSNEDIDNFIIEQNADYMFEYDQIVYYEDLYVHSKYKINQYLKPNSEIFSNFDLVLERLGNYKYADKE